MNADYCLFIKIHSSLHLFEQDFITNCMDVLKLESNDVQDAMTDNITDEEVVDESDNRSTASSLTF